MLSSCDEKTQYALLASIGTAGRTLFAAASGALMDWLDGDWGTFFVITTLMVVPSLICLWAIRKRLGDLLAGARVRLSGKEAEGGSGGNGLKLPEGEGVSG